MGHHGQAKLFHIDAQQAFDVNVNACLLYLSFENGEVNNECKVYGELTLDSYQQTFAQQDKVLVAELSYYKRWQHLQAKSIPTQYRWRSRVKHDCARIMELQKIGDVFVNRTGEQVMTYLYPMLKSSDVVKWKIGQSIDRWMLVTQREVGQETRSIEQVAPQTWAYLMHHAELLAKRKSSIYKRKPRFSVFGVGDYTFAPWKVVISGLYKQLTFALVGSIDGKPIVLDDTCYLLPCHSKEEGELLLKLVQSEPAQQFFEAFIFWDAKRPITSKLLNSLDITKLANELGIWTELKQYQNMPRPVQMSLFA